MHIHMLLKREIKVVSEMFYCLKPVLDQEETIMSLGRMTYFEEQAKAIVLLIIVE